MDRIIPALGMLLEAVFRGYAVALLLCSAMVMARQFRVPLRRFDQWVPLVSVALSVAACWRNPAAVVAMAGGYGVVIALRRRCPYLHPPGAAVVAYGALIFLVSALWLTGRALDPALSPMSRALLLSFTLLLVLGGPTALLRTFLGLEALYRDSWRTPDQPCVPGPAHTAPRVSIHVPCHCEPPDVVIATLDSLAALDYDNFEVLVIDNNTSDPALWRPVETHCARLGPRFRFFHVEGLAGAKAGALNYALERTSPDAGLIALVDADYHVSPDFLAELVGHFGDTRLGYVQSRYDFRDWTQRRFLAMCFWEYRFAFPTVMRSLYERQAGFPMGTMGILRKSALYEIGGWAPWSLTEDSELGLRLHAAGYRALLVQRTYGHGLIPERFADYTKQRFRWTYGPVQTFKQHWRLVVPGRSSGANALSGTQRMLQLYWATAHVPTALGIALGTPLLVAVIVSMIAHHEPWAIGTNTILAAGIAAGLQPMLRWTALHKATGAGWAQVLASTLASAALTYTIAAANFSALCTSNTAWRRTDKFRAHSHGGSWRALRYATTELALGTSLVIAAALTFLTDHSGMLILLEAALALRGCQLLAAPVAAVLAAVGINRARRAEPVPVC
ncbi:glycosyltransferase family 2 protein [Nocardia sp. XZ_19_385]|uniref:glycosyltransferase family 2 protein n=1 Tax=Nocardia sp. XZ_19_385 TaxID=2769488 RepID=UPI00188E3E99|nr:glycosyltransferase [Nocardia sp. XZ_19_385]